MRSMFRRLLRNVNNNFDQAVISLSIMAIGIFLWADKTYFTWPPQLRPIMNSEYSDVFYIVLGLMLLFCTLTGNKNKALHDIFITIAGGATLILLTEQLWHVVFAQNFDMTMAVILDVVLFILILRCSYKN